MDLKKAVVEDNAPVFDVRKEGEYLSEHIVGAEHTCLSTVTNNISQFPSDKKFYIHCQGGYRSMITSSILKSRGIHNFIDVAGGFDAIKEVGTPLTDYVCPSTL